MFAKVNHESWLIHHKVKADLPEILRKNEVEVKEDAWPQFESKYLKVDAVTNQDGIGASAKIHFPHKNGTK